MLEHRPDTDYLKLTAIEGDVLLNRRSKGATPAWQLVKKGNSTTFSYCTVNHLYRTQASPSDVQRRDGV